MRILLDTNILLNDFFYRHPEFGQTRISDPAQLEKVEKYRSLVHQALENLSRLPDVGIYIPAYLIPRLVSIFADVFVPDYLVNQEIAWILNNATLVPFGLEEIEESMVLSRNWPQSYPEDEQPGLEELMLYRAAQLAKAEAVLTVNTKGRNHLGGITLIKPEQVSI